MPWPTGATARPGPPSWKWSKARRAVRAAALRAVGRLGAAADVPLLVRTLSQPAGSENTAAKASLTRLHGPTVSQAIAAELPRAKSRIRVELIGILAARRARDASPASWPPPEDADPKVRMAAMAALGKLAEPGTSPPCSPDVLKATGGPEREAAEKAVMFVCNGTRTPTPGRALLGRLDKFSDGRPHGVVAHAGPRRRTGRAEDVEAAMADADPPRREAGFRALCNWPDASVVARLLDLVQTADSDREHRTAALRALIRVAALPDKRTDAGRLDLLKKAMALATRDEERQLGVGPLHGRADDGDAALRRALHGPAGVGPAGVRQRGRAGPPPRAAHPEQGRVRPAAGQGDSHQQGRQGDRPAPSGTSRGRRRRPLRTVGLYSLRVTIYDAGGKQCSQRGQPIVLAAGPLNLVLPRRVGSRGNGDWLRRLDNGCPKTTACGDGACPLFRDGRRRSRRKRGTGTVAAAFLPLPNQLAPRSQSPFSANPAQ